MNWTTSQDLFWIFICLLALAALGWLLSAVAEAIRNARLRREEYRAWLMNGRLK